MHPVNERHERFSHVLAQRSLASTSGPATLTSPSASTTSTATATASPPVRVNDSPRSGAAFAAAPASSKCPIFGVSPSENHATPVDAAAFWTPREHNVPDAKSPVLNALRSSATLHAPATPSNWMVRGPSGDGSPAALSALGAHTTHDSASSFNSSAGNPTLSPLLHPHSGSPAHSASEVEGCDSAFFPMERASGRKRTPRSVALSGLGSSSGGGGFGGAASGDAETVATPSSTRLILSRRTSAGGSVYDAGDESPSHVHPRRPGSVTYVEDDAALLSSQTRRTAEGLSEDDAMQPPCEAHRGEAQSMLHSSRSRGSGTATSTIRASSPLASGVMPALALGTTVMAHVMSDVPTSTPTVELVRRLSSGSPLAASAPLAAVEAEAGSFATASGTGTGSTHLAHTSAIESSAAPTLRSAAAASAAAASSLHTRCPSTPRSSRSGSGGHTRPARATSGVVQRSHGHGIHPAHTAPNLKGVAKPPELHMQASRKPCSTAGEGTAHGSNNKQKASSPTNVTSAHFTSTAELPTWPRYSTASSCASLVELSNNAEAEEEEEEEEKGMGTSIKGDGAHASMLHQAAASATAVVDAYVALPAGAASMTVFPYDTASPLGMSDTPSPAATRSATALADARVHALPAHTTALTPLMDAWTASPLPGASVEHSAANSRSSSIGKGNGREPNDHHHNHNHSLHNATVGRPFTTRTATATAAAAAATSPALAIALPEAPVPVLSSTETHLASPGTAQAHNTGNFLNYHPNFSRNFFSRFSTPSALLTPPGASTPGAGCDAALASSGAGHNITELLPPPPPPPPPPSRIPSPLPRAAATIASGFASTPTHQRITSTFSTGYTTAQSSGRVTPANGLHVGMCSPPPPPSLSAEGCEVRPSPGRCLPTRDSFSTPMRERLSLPRHVAEKDSVAPATREDGVRPSAEVHSARTLQSHRSTPDEGGGVEAIVDGMAMMVLPPAALRVQHDGSGPVVGCPNAHSQHHPHQHHHQHHQPSQRSRVRGSSLGSNGGFAGTHNTALSAARPSGQSKEFLFTSESSLNTSTPQTLTSTASDPMLLSFSSANLAAPMTSTGSNATNISNGGALSPGGGPSVPCVPVASPHPTENFVMRPDAETVQRLPRGKVPRMPGCSMRDWTAHLVAKEAENRREQQQQQQQQRYGSGSARSSQQQPLRTSGSSFFSGPSSLSSAGMTTTFSSPASQHPPGSRGALPRMTPQEVAKHNTPDDLWMVIRNVVYDCTEFQRFHPGGEKLLLACAGRDATEVYDRFHAWVSCESFMGPYAVGVLAHPR